MLDLSFSLYTSFKLVFKIDPYRGTKEYHKTMSKNHGSIIVGYFLLEKAPELMDMNCSDEQNNEDKVLMLMNVVLVKSDIVQSKTDSMKYILKSCRAKYQRNCHCSELGC